MEKEEIARNEQFLLFPQCFLLNQKIVFPFVNILDIISLFASELEEPKIGLSGKGLKENKKPIVYTWIVGFMHGYTVKYTLALHQSWSNKGTLLFWSYLTLKAWSDQLTDL